MADKRSKLRRSRNPKKSEGQKSACAGRRGRKHHSEQRKKAKQKRAKAKQKRIELAERPHLAKKVEAKIKRICANCELGHARPFKGGTQKYNSSGLILASGWEFGGYRYAGRYFATGFPKNVGGRYEVVLKWSEMSTKHLKKLLNGIYVPEKEKCVLDLIVVAVS